MTNRIRNIVSLILCAAVFCVAVFQLGGLKVYAEEPVVVVIDPGHGGKNLGTDYLSIPEKAYTLMVALYMKEHLETYQNVKVYMTRTQDIDVDLEDRAEFAKSVNADFLFSLHFNMSLSHTLYGSEVWIPSTGTLYSQAYSAGNEFMKQFEEMGLFNRGIKTRIGDRGDYYGIIRHCTTRNIPSIIVEHCHVDNVNDIANIQSPEKLKEFGIRDAEAVAKYFGLTSKDNKTDYSTYAPLAVPTPASIVYNDTTPPEYVTAKLVKYDKTSKYATVELTAIDNESALQYYAFSCDNGTTWSTFQPWKRGVNTMTATVNLGLGKKTNVLFKVSNIYDRETTSNVLTLN
ncbi:MAG: N-acetylmuramoyl-L-alanine amidase [Lachnospiraceae bacterium]|nr:N-acetylmuramoyl-L-alanine amidase [Lachnospiraceae bacterium]